MSNWKRYVFAAVIVTAGGAYLKSSHRSIPADLRDAVNDAGLDSAGESDNRSCSCKPFLNITDSPQAKDFTGIETAPSLGELRAAFSERTDPFYKRYSDAGLINKGGCIDSCYDQMPYRYSNGDRCSYEHIQGRTGGLGKNVAVFMDSGGAHSIAMATFLVNEAGYTPVIKLNEPLERPAIKEDAASIKFFARALFAKDNAGGPPVFIMNAHRNSTVKATFSEKDFPSPRELLEKGINKVVWITEGATDGKPERMDEARLKTLTDCSSDPADILKAYSEYDGGKIEVSQMRIDPYDCPYSIINRFDPRTLMLSR